MSSIDERVVDMQFKNGQFEKGVAQTTKSIADLEKSLKLEGATKGLNNLDAAGKKINLGHIAQGIDNLTAKFSALGVIGVTALATITNKAIDAGLALAKSLTIDPIKSGFDEYELKMGSIQTILSNTARYGTKLAEVTANLDELNEYADKTIYNFGDMTKNIGLFTNAGIRVGDATAMIKGFSNEAAASGTSAQGAASAAYQLSQALSAGKVTLMDWRSLQNVGMGNKNMQKGILDIAGAMGTLEDKGLTSKGVMKDFNGSLKHGWLSADVMSNYLKIMAGEMSDAEMKALGLTKAQIKLFKTQQKNAEEAATKVRTFSQLIGTLRESVGSGWAESFGIILGDFNEATEVFTGLNDTIGGIFNRMSDARNHMLEEWKEAGGRTAAIDAIKNAFAALSSIVVPIKDAFREIFPATTGKQLADMTKAIRDFLATLKLSSENGERLKTTFKGIFAIFSIGWTIIKSIVGVFFDLFSLFTGAGPGGVLAVTGSFSELILKVHDFLVTGGAIENFFDNLGSTAKAVFGPIIDFISRMVEAFGDLFRGDTEGFLDKFRDSFKAFAPLVDAVTSRFETLINIISDGVDKAREFVEQFGGAAMGPIQNALDGIAGLIEKIRGHFDFKPDFNTKGIAEAVGGMGLLETVSSKVSGAWNGLSKMFSGIAKMVAPALEGIADLFATISSKIKEYIEGLDFQDAVALINTGFFIALYIALRKFIGNLRDLVQEGKDFLRNIADSIVGTFDALTNALKTMQMNVQANIILKIAVALAILVAAVWTLSKIPAEDLARALGGIAALMSMLLVTLKAFDKFGLVDQAGILKTGAALVLLAVAIKILASAVEQLSALSWGELAKGLVSVGGILLGLALFTKFAETSKQSIKGTASLLVLAGAVYLLSIAIEKLGTMDIGTLQQGGIALGLIIAILTGASVAMGMFGGKGAAAILAMTAALAAFVPIIITLGLLPFDVLRQGMGALAVGLGLLTAATVAMGIFGAKAAPGVVAMSAALLVLTAVVAIFGNMDMVTLAKGLGALAIALGIVTVATIAMGIFGAQAAPGMLAMSVALLALAAVVYIFGSMDLLALGIGLAALAVGLTIVLAAGLAAMYVAPGLGALAVAVIALGAAMLLAGLGFLAFATGFAMLAAIGAAGFAVLIVGFQGLLNLIPLFAQQIALGLIAFAKVISDAGPVIVEALTTILMSLLRALDRIMPKLIDTLGRFILLMANKVVQLAPRLYDAGMRMIIGFMKVISARIPTIVRLAVDIMIRFIRAISDNVPRLADAGAKAVIRLVNGISTAIDRNSAELGRAGGRLAVSLIRGLASGITNGVGEVVGAAQRMAGNIVGAIAGVFDSHSPSRVMIKEGKNLDDGLAIGLKKYSDVATSAAEDVGHDTIDGMRKAISGISDVVQGDMDMTPVITPVLDLDEVRKNAGLIPGIFGGTPVVGGNIAFSNNAASIEALIDSLRGDGPDDPGGIPAGTQVTYNQYNNSPKALSTAEIYRQTNNQLSKAIK